jgi:hypothetical protein
MVESKLSRAPLAPNATHALSQANSGLVSQLMLNVETELDHTCHRCHRVQYQTSDQNQTLKFTEYHCWSDQFAFFSTFFR